jgi:hypothetical protein
MRINKIRLGRTNLLVSEVAFGGIPVMRLGFDEGAELVRKSIDLGVDFIDTAHDYGDSEEKIGEALKSFSREKIVLSSKSPGRDRETFEEHLSASLQRLKTDYIDIYHLHHVSSEETFDKVFAPGGAVEGLEDAVKAGKVRYPAVSCHNADIAVKCIETGRFDVLQFPINFVDIQAEKKVLPRCRDLDIGFIAMKPLGGGMLEDAELCFKYLQQLGDMIPDPGIEGIEELEEILQIYERRPGLTPRDRERIRQIRENMGKNWCHRCDYCRPCPEGIPISTILITESIFKRMDFTSAEEFLGAAMEKVSACTECEQCVERCPYDLPIPDLLKEKRRVYEEAVREHK